MGLGLPGELRGRRCLVTGGLGFIGSRLTEVLATGGAEVVVLDSLLSAGSPRSATRTVEGIDVRIGDIGDPAEATAAVAGADYIFNLAGRSSHVAWLKDPLSELEASTRAHLAFLEVVRSVSPSAKVVYTSTRQVYGRQSSSPVTEDAVTDPVDLSALCKLTTERFHVIYQRVFGLNTTSLRLANAYGPGQLESPNSLAVIPTFVGQALRREPITVFGEGHLLLNTIHVDDAVSALVTAATREGSPGRVYNIAHSEVLALIDIANLIAEAVGGASIHHVATPPEWEAQHVGSVVMDLRRAHDELGWDARIPFADGIRQTIRSYS